MANLNVKSAAGGKLKLQRHTGADALTIDTHGNVQVAGTITTGTLTNAVAVPQEVIKKFHHMTNNTRTAGSNSANQTPFHYAPTFTPLDPDNNSFHVFGAVPGMGVGQDHTGYGLQFRISDANAVAKGYAGVDIPINFVGRGINYYDITTADRQTTQSYNFTIGAGELIAGTYTVSHYIQTGSSNMLVYNHNSSDDARTATQTQSELMIIEYANI